MSFRSEYRAFVYLAVIAVVGMILAPDYLFFAMIALLSLAGGAYLLVKGSALWGVLMMIAGVGLVVLALQCYRKHLRAEADEAAKAENEITRRMGRGPRV